MAHNDYFHSKALDLGKRDRTRARLIDAAIEANYVEGPIDLAARTVAKYAGMSSGTFHNHFDDIDDVRHQAMISIAMEIHTQNTLDLVHITDPLRRICSAAIRLLLMFTGRPAWGILATYVQRSKGVTAQPLAEPLMIDITRAVTEKKLKTMPTPFTIALAVDLFGDSISYQIRNGVNDEDIRKSVEIFLLILGFNKGPIKKAFDQSFAALSDS